LFTPKFATNTQCGRDKSTGNHLLIAACCLLPGYLALVRMQGDKGLNAQQSHPQPQKEAAVAGTEGSINAAAGAEGSSLTAAILKAIKAESAAAAAQQETPSKTRKRRPQPQHQHQQPQHTTSPLGRAATRMLKDHLHAKLLPGLPNEEQLQYYELADRPFSASELVQLHSQYLTPKTVRTVQADAGIASSSVSSGSSRESRHVSKSTRAEQQFPLLAPGLLRLRDAVYVFKHSTSRAEIPASAVPQNPAACKLLLALRCLSEWGGKMVQQQEPPMLLQVLLLGKVHGGGRDESTDVVEYVNLAEDDDREQEQQRQQQLFEESGEDCLMVHVEQGSAASGASGAAVAVKKELGV
jgi:hypothetical protein